MKAWVSSIFPAWNSLYFGDPRMYVIYQIWKFLNFYFLRYCLFPILSIIFIWNFFRIYVRTSYLVCSIHLLLSKKPHQNLVTTTILWFNHSQGRAEMHRVCSRMSGTLAGNTQTTSSDPKSWDWTLYMVWDSSKHCSHRGSGFVSCQGSKNNYFSKQGRSYIAF